MATTSAPGRTSSMLPMDSEGTASARRRPVAGRVGGPDSGSGDEGTGVIVTSVPHTRGPGRWRLRASRARGQLLPGKVLDGRRTRLGGDPERSAPTVG